MKQNEKNSANIKENKEPVLQDARKRPQPSEHIQKVEHQRDRISDQGGKKGDKQQKKPQ